MISLRNLDSHVIKGYLIGLGGVYGSRMTPFGNDLWPSSSLMPLMLHTMRIQFA